MYMYKYMYVFFVFFNETCDNLYEKHNITKLLIMSSSLYLKSQHSAQGHLCDLYSFIYPYVVWVETNQSGERKKNDFSGIWTRFIWSETTRG